MTSSNGHLLLHRRDVLPPPPSLLTHCHQHFPASSPTTALPYIGAFLEDERAPLGHQEDGQARGEGVRDDRHPPAEARVAGGQEHSPDICTQPTPHKPSMPEPFRIPRQCRFCLSSCKLSIPP